MGYENYFIYKNDKNDTKYSLEEYVVWNLYTENFIAPFSSQKKTSFFSLFNNYLSKYTHEGMKKISIVSFNLVQIFEFENDVNLIFMVVAVKQLFYLLS